MNLEQLNWELCEAYLKDTEEAMHEAVENLEASLEKLQELKELI